MEGGLSALLMVKISSGAVAVELESGVSALGFLLEVILASCL